MTSVCITQTGYQQQPCHFQMYNGKLLMMQQTHHHQPQQPAPTQQQSQQYAKKYQSIVPAVAPKVLGNSNAQNVQSNVGPMLPRKKYYTQMPYGEQLPSVARRNARERNRVKQVNNGFANLRQHLPQTVINALSHGGRGASKKLSKVDTLRIALEYIRSLQDILTGGTPSNLNSQLLDDTSSNDGSNCAYSSVDSAAELNAHQLPRSYHSEASVSPAPSYSDSDISNGGANYMQPLDLEQQQNFKFEHFDDLELAHDDEQLSDEELLDYISTWQKQ